MNRTGAKTPKRGSKGKTAKSTPKRKLSTKRNPKKLLQSTAFLQTKPQFGLFDTPQDLPTSPKRGKYVDFFKDTPVTSLAGQLVRDLRDFALIQTGSPQYFDRDYEQQKLLGKEQYAAFKKQMDDNNYAGYQGFDELEFQTSYYKRVDMVPDQGLGQKLRINPTHSQFRESPDHIVQYCNVTNPHYIAFRDHEAKNTGCVSAGPYFVPRVKFQFPIMSVDNDYLYFHD